MDRRETSGGPVRDKHLEDFDRNYSVAMHLSPFAALVLGPPCLLAPLILWLIRKDRSPFTDDHGREIVNFGLSMLLFGVLFVWTVVVPLILLVVVVVNLIRGAVSAGRGEYFRYPMTIRFLS